MLVDRVDRRRRVLLGCFDAIGNHYVLLLRDEEIVVTGIGIDERIAEGRRRHFAGSGD